MIEIIDRGNIFEDRGVFRFLPKLRVLFLTVTSSAAYQQLLLMYSKEALMDMAHSLHLLSMQASVL